MFYSQNFSKMSMNKTTKVLSIGIAMFAIVGLMGVLNNNQVFADPAPEGTKKVYQFNMIARPNSYDGGCGEGNRMFVEADARHAHVVITGGSEWNVTDCNATSGNKGELTVDGTGTFAVYAIAHGKPNTGLDICADSRSVHEEDEMAGDEHECLMGTFEIKREGGKSNMKLVPSSLFDTSLEDVIWSLDVYGNAKVQFRVYEVLS